MRFQRRDVDFELLWNVATLISNVATLIFNILWNVATLASTSRRWKISSLECRDVAPNVATLSCLRLNTPHFFAPTLPSSYLNPSVLCRAPTQTLARVHFLTGRRPFFCPLTPSLTPLPPSLSTNLSPLSLLAISTLYLSVIALVQSSTLGLGVHV